MKKTNIARAIVLCSLLTQSGCFKLGRDTPVLQQYVLAGGGAQASPAAPQRADGIIIGVRRLDLATYLAIPAIVTRRGAHQIVISEFHRWGEEPGAGINRALAGHLRMLPGVRAADVAPWAPRAPHDYLVQLHVMRFEGVADSLATQGEAQLRATWEIIRPNDGAVLARGSTDYRQPGWQVGDYASLVRMLDDGLSGVARDVVTCVARFPAGTLAAEPATVVPLACATQGRG
jgi:uncharacterized lipoprotein YmbA